MTKHEDHDAVKRSKQLLDEQDRYLKESRDDVILVMWTVGVMGVAALIGMTVAIFVTGA